MNAIKDSQKKKKSSKLFELARKLAIAKLKAMDDADFWRRLRAKPKRRKAT